MARRAVRRQDPLLQPPKDFWLATLVRTLAIIVISYFVAIFVNLVIGKLADMPHGPLWDAALRGPVFFIMLLLVTCVISIPYWMKDWDPSLRTFSMFTCAFIITYAIFDGSGVIDPEMPLKWLMTAVVDPLKHKLVP